MNNNYRYFKFNDGNYFRLNEEKYDFQVLENNLWNDDDSLISLFLYNIRDYKEIKDEEKINELASFAINNDSFIKEIFEKVKNYVLCDIDDKYINELSKGYLKYLINEYGSKDFNKIGKLKAMDIIIEIEAETWKNTSSDYRLSKLISADYQNSTKKS